MAVFQGAGVAIVTPFKANGEVNYDKFAELLEFQIKNGTDAIIVCGTTGEASTLSHEEHLDVIKFCVERVAKRIPVVAGTGSNCTETAIYLSTEAEKPYGMQYSAGNSGEALHGSGEYCGSERSQRKYFAGGEADVPGGRESGFVFRKR